MAGTRRAESLALINRNRATIDRLTPNGVERFKKLVQHGVKLFDLSQYNVSENTVWLGPTNIAHEDKGATYEGVISEKGGIHWRVVYEQINQDGRRHSPEFFSHLIDHTDYKIALLVTPQTFSDLPNGTPNYARNEFDDIANQILNEADSARKRELLKRVDFVFAFPENH